MNFVKRRTVARAGLLAGAALVMALLVACGDGNGDSGSPDATPTAAIEIEGVEEVVYRGARVTPPLPKPDLVLTDTSGEPFDILPETEGYLTLLYLGYTHCPDFCPTHLFEVSKALEMMDPAVVERIRVVFITTDPERDDAAAIRRWLDIFDERFIGLTIDPETLSTLVTSLGMPPIEKYNIDENGYEVSHATYLIAYTGDNLGHIVYPFLMGGGLIDIMAHDLPLLAENGWQEPS